MTPTSTPAALWVVLEFCRPVFHPGSCPLCFPQDGAGELSRARHDALDDITTPCTFFDLFDRIKRKGLSKLILKQHFKHFALELL